MRFVRSTSVTLKVLKSHDSDVLWRVQLLSSAIVHLRICHHERQERQWKSYLMLLFLKKQIQKKQKQKQKQHPNEPALNNTVLDSLRKEVRLLLVKKKHRVLYGPHQAQRDHKGGTREVVCRFLIGDMSDKDSNWRIAKLVWLSEPETTYTSKPHSFSFLFFKNM